MIEVGDQDDVTIVRMADGKANAMSIDFCELLTAQFEKLNSSPTRAIVITGNGRIFSAASLRKIVSLSSMMAVWRSGGSSARNRSLIEAMEKPCSSRVKRAWSKT